MLAVCLFFVYLQHMNKVRTKIHENTEAAKRDPRRLEQIRARRKLGYSYIPGQIMVDFIYESWTIDQKKEPTQEDHLNKLRKRLGYSRLPWPWAVTRIWVYFLIFLTYAHAIVWVRRPTQLPGLVWLGAEYYEESIQMLMPLYRMQFQLSLIIWSRLPTILQW